MPMYRTHLLGGCCVYGSLLYMLCHIKSFTHPNVPTAFGWFVLTLVGALFPDIDVKSKMQKWTYTILLILLMVLAWHRHFELIAFVSILFFIPLVVHHRGLFHRSWFILFLGLAIVLLTQWYIPVYTQVVTYDVFFFVAGALSHIWLDLGLRRMLQLRW